MSRPASRASHHHPSGPATAGNCISSRPEFPQANIVPKKSQTPVVRHPSTGQHLIAQRHCGPKRPFGSATIYRAEAPSQGSAPGCPLGHAKPPAEPTRRSPSSRPFAGHPRCGPYREPQLQQAPTKRDPSSSASRASINALRNPRNGSHQRVGASDIDSKIGPTADSVACDCYPISLVRLVSSCSSHSANHSQGSWNFEQSRFRHSSNVNVFAIVRSHCADTSCATSSSIVRSRFAASSKKWKTNKSHHRAIC